MSDSVSHVSTCKFDIYFFVLLEFHYTWCLISVKLAIFKYLYVIETLYLFVAHSNALPDSTSGSQSFIQSASGDPGMNMAAPMHPPPNMVHPSGYGPDVVINTSPQGTDTGMFSPPGIPPSMFQTVMDPSGNIMQVIAYPQYMVGMHPHGAAGPSSAEGYLPMLGNMAPMATHGMGAHGAHQMPMPGVPVSYAMGVGPQDTAGLHTQ